MIEPLRICHEVSTPLQIAKPLLCEVCINTKSKRNNPKLASRCCHECVRQYICKDCDDEIHSLVENRHHLCRSLVVGPGVRKKVLRRGDATNFPHSLDLIAVKMSSKVVHKGRTIHEEAAKKVRFTVGLSGLSVHVQILGARNLVVADLNETSDPFITAVFAGKKLGSTRVRPRELNPMWDNETFIVPLEDNFADPLGMPKSQKNLFRLEAYDFDWFTLNNFLGQVEISRRKLYKMALASKEKPICLPLTLREFHGILGIRMGVDKEHFLLEVTRAEALDKINPIYLDTPYAKVYFCDELIGTTSTVSNTLDPHWKSGNVFRVKINEILDREREVLLYMQQHQKSAESIPVPGMTVEQFQHSLSNESSSESFPRPMGYGERSSLFDHNTVSLIEGSESEGGNGGRVGAASASSFYRSRSEKSQDEIDFLFSVADDNVLLFRIELYHHNTILPPVHLGTSRITMNYLRKLLPCFPRSPIPEKIPFLSRQLSAILRGGIGDASNKSAANSIKNRITRLISGGSASASVKSTKEGGLSGKLSMFSRGKSDATNAPEEEQNVLDQPVDSTAKVKSSRLALADRFAALYSGKNSSDTRKESVVAQDPESSDQIVSAREESSQTAQSAEGALTRRPSRFTLSSKSSQQAQARLSRKSWRMDSQRALNVSGKGDDGHEGSNRRTSMRSFRGGSFAGPSASSMKERSSELVDRQVSGSVSRGHSMALESSLVQETHHEQEGDDDEEEEEEEDGDNPMVQYQRLLDSFYGSDNLKAAPAGDNWIMENNDGDKILRILSGKGFEAEKRNEDKDPVLANLQERTKEQGSVVSDRAPPPRRNKGGRIIGSKEALEDEAHARMLLEKKKREQEEQMALLRGPSRATRIRPPAPGESSNNSIDGGSSSECKPAEIGGGIDGAGGSSESLPKEPVRLGAAGKSLSFLLPGEIDPRSRVISLANDSVSLQESTEGQDLPRPGDLANNSSIGGVPSGMVSASPEFGFEAGSSLELQEGSSFVLMPGIALEDSNLLLPENSESPVRDSMTYDRGSESDGNYQEEAADDDILKRGGELDEDDGADPRPEKKKIGLLKRKAASPRERHEEESKVQSLDEELEERPDGEDGDGDPAEMDGPEEDAAVPYYGVDSHGHKITSSHPVEIAHQKVGVEQEFTYFDTERDGLVAPLGDNGIMDEPTAKNVFRGPRNEDDANDNDGDDEDDEENDEIGSEEEHDEQRDAVQGVSRHAAAAFVDEGEALEDDEGRPLLENQGNADGPVRRPSIFERLQKPWGGGGGLSRRRFSSKLFGRGLDEAGGDDDDNNNGKDKKNEESQGISRRMSLLGLNSRKLSRMFSVRRSPSDLAEDSAESANSVIWSPVRHFHVEQISSRNTAMPEKTNRGYLVVRLIPSTRGDALVGLDEAVRHMSLGETALVKLRYDFAYGNFCMGGSIPPRANMVFRVELHSINDRHRYSFIRRILLRLIRNLRLLYKRVSKRIIAWHRYNTEHKPFLHFIAPAMKYCFGIELFPVVEEEPSEEEEIEEPSEAEDEDDFSLEESEDLSEPKVKIDKRMKKLVDQSVLAGAKLVWGFDPNNRLVNPRLAEKRAKKARLEALRAAKLVKQRERQLMKIDEEKDAEGDEDRAEALRIAAEFNEKLELHESRKQAAKEKRLQDAGSDVGSSEGEDEDLVKRRATHLSRLNSNSSQGEDSLDSASKVERDNESINSDLSGSVGGGKAGGASGSRTRGHHGRGRTKSIQSTATGGSSGGGGDGSRHRTKSMESDGGGSQRRKKEKDKDGAASRTKDRRGSALSQASGDGSSSATGAKRRPPKPDSK